MLLVAVLTGGLCATILDVYVGWEPLLEGSAVELTATGYVAMAIALAAALTLGAGLMALVVRRRGRR
ncbi:MAG: hypothetical protein U1E23_12165 [Reyranellaceae bacterium]